MTKASANDAGQSTAQAIDKWRVAWKTLLQSLDWLATYADEHQTNSIVFYPIDDADPSPTQRQKLFDDLLNARKAIAKTLRDGADDLLTQAGELRERQVEIMPRLELASNELAKLRGQAGGYEYAWATLEPLAYATRRWAVELADLWKTERLAIDSRTQKAFDKKRESCSWSLAHSQAYRQRFNDELSQLLRDLSTHPPLVLFDGKGPLTPNKKQVGGGRKKRKSKGELTDAQELLAAALREWHGFDAESLSCTRCEAISYAILCERSGQKSKATAAAFFRGWLPEGGNEYYRQVLCQGDAKALAIAIAKLSRETLLQVLPVAAEALADAKAKCPGDDNDD